jgi:hypothetical protein
VVVNERPDVDRINPNALVVLYSIPYRVSELLVDAHVVEDLSIYSFRLLIVQ